MIIGDALFSHGAWQTLLTTQTVAVVEVGDLLSCLGEEQDCVACCFLIPPNPLHHTLSASSSLSMVIGTVGAGLLCDFCCNAIQDTPRLSCL